MCAVFKCRHITTHNRMIFYIWFSLALMASDIFNISVVSAVCTRGDALHAGYFTNTSGVCDVCPVGWKCPSNTPYKSICQAGTMQPIPASVDCIDCPVNTFNSLTGSNVYVPLRKTPNSHFGVSTDYHVPLTKTPNSHFFGVD